jgi:hypothetical protein
MGKTNDCSIYRFLCIDESSGLAFYPDKYKFSIMPSLH